MFFPNEIIFSCTTACNLQCSHCFVSRNPVKLSGDAAISFMESCKKSASCNIEKIGFSGGEPFLYLDFLQQVIKSAVEMDFMFDQIMTNGDWWQTEEDLYTKLQLVYDAGYDGKIGLSWDSFHGQSRQRMNIFANAVHKIFGPDSLNIQSVVPFDHSEDNQQDYHLADTPFYELAQSFPGNDKRTWQSKKWFKEDFCEGPGQVLYIHSDGNIAPCCGFANENPALFIGTLNDTYDEVMQKASENKMIKICYETGLLKYKKQVKKLLHSQRKKLPGKCSDICGFCDYVMNLEK